MTIRLLSETIAARIAAGEVVERPASVVKELVENSLDAGANHIEAEINRGGRDLIRIRDNGEGIRSHEVELAFRRHATSKLENASDLERISTLGFRGEALASIASVSRVTCTTRHPDEETGTSLRLEGGTVVSRTAVGRPQGTEILIEDLFYNVPARRKFLRSERTERRHIDAFLTRYAIAYPEIAIDAVHDGKEVLSTSGNSVTQEILFNVYGMDLGSSLLPIPTEFTAEQEIRIAGFVGPTTAHRADRGYITLFLNGRWIQDLRLSYAIIQAYHTLLPIKRYPIAFVKITMPPQEVDVNVHPAKTEIRLHDADAVFRAVQRTIRATVIQEAPVTATWQPDNPPPAERQPANDTRARLAALMPVAKQIALPEAPARAEISSNSPALDFSTPQSATAAVPGSSPTQAHPFDRAQPNLPPLRVIGQASTMFIIAEGPDGLYLIDQHAAHERILYEQMIGEWASGNIPSQPLLEPLSVTLPLDEAGRLDSILPSLHALGLEIEPFGPGTFLVRSLPMHLTSVAPTDLVADIAAHATDRSPVRMELEEMIIRRICKRIAVKAGQVLSHAEMEHLIKDLEKTDNPRTCPHGRPTIVQISVEALAKQFGRG